MNNLFILNEIRSSPQQTSKNKEVKTMDEITLALLT